jgi:flavin reductase (DIM6/NTAB) family NADH-FMN oxidoreductase RutF
MIDYEAFFKVSYGLYIVSTGDKSVGNGFISNSVFQVTSEPPQFAACCSKDNYTAELIAQYGSYAISVLSQEAQTDLIARFGYKSGRNIGKLEGMHIRHGETDTPIVLDGSVAWIECKLIKTVDVGTHLLYIGEAVHAALLDGTEAPMTYSYYREARKGMAPKNAPTYVDRKKLVKKEKDVDNTR